MSDPSTEQEPTMEEILSSIRRIIADDDDGGSAEAASDSEDDEEEDVEEDDVDDGDFNLAEELEPELEHDEPELDDELDDEPVLLATGEDAELDAEALDLTSMVQDDGSVLELDQDGNALHTPAAEREPAPPESYAVQAAQAGPGLLDDSLLHDATTNAAASAFAHLSSAATAVRGQSLGDPALTLEDLVKELLRPMLKAWLDKNLPAVVERIVEKEIAKIAHGADK